MQQRNKWNDRISYYYLEAIVSMKKKTDLETKYEHVKDIDAHRNNHQCYLVPDLTYTNHLGTHFLCKSYNHKSTNK